MRKAQRPQFRRFDLRCQMDSCGPFDIPSLEQGDPGTLCQRAFAADQILHKHSAGRQHIRHAGLSGRLGGSRGRPEKNRVQMDDIEVCNVRMQRLPHPRRTIQAAPDTGRKIPHIDTIELHWPIERNGQYSVPVHIGRVDMHLVALRGECRSQSVHRPDRATITDGRIISGNDVKDLH